MAEETARKEAEKRVEEQAASNQKLRKREKFLWLLSGGITLVGLVAIYVSFDANQQKILAQVKEQAANVQTELAVETNVHPLILALATTGKNQKRINENWVFRLTNWAKGFKPGTGLIRETQDGLFNAVETVHERNLFKGHEDYVISVAFSPDGKTIVSGSLDKTVRLWDTNGKPIGQPFKGHEEAVYSVAFSPDGKTIVSGSYDKTVRLWTLAWPIWLQLGCHRLRLHPDFISPAREDASQEEVNILQGAVETCLELGGWNNQQKTEFLMQQKAKFREQKAELLVQQGLELAQKKADLEAARIKFAEAKKLDASIVDYSKLETEMKSFAPQWISKGITEVKEGNVASALTLYEKAQQINPAIVNAKSWKGLCWFGSIYGSAKDVLFACEKAVKLASAKDKTGYRDSEGLAKALTGDSQGAISDFQSYVDDPQQDAKSKLKRQQWIKALKKGQNPFTPEVLEQLKNE